MADAVVYYVRSRRFLPPMFQNYYDSSTPRIHDDDLL